MDKALQTFEDLVRRAIAPSMTFFVLWAAAELVRFWLVGEWLAGAFMRDGVTRTIETQGEVSIRIMETQELVPLVEVIEKVPAVFTILAILAIVGLSYSLAAAQQVLFDNRLKKNFEPLHRGVWRRVRNRNGQSLAESDSGMVSRSEEASGNPKAEESISDHEALSRLRKEVRGRLADLEVTRRLGEIEGLSDYVLYEILGGIDTINTRPFADSAKAIGIFFTSVMVLSISYLVMFCKGDNGVGAVVMVILFGVAWLLGLEATRTQYRMRAIRLYVNFLAMPCDFIHRRLLKEDWPESKKDGS